MASEWANYRVDDIANVTDYVANGSFATLKKNVTYSSTPDFAILVRLVDFKSGWNGNYVYVPKKSYRFLKKSSLDVGDVVISNVGANAGTVFRVPDLGKPATLGPNSIVIKTEGKETLRNFLYYYFTAPIGQNKIQSIITGSAQPKFNKTDFRALSIKIPINKHEQLAIVNILGSLDDKIELNRQMNKTLEAMARAIFKSWFVDFDPVHAKAEGRPTGLPDEIDALFPDSFEESKMGEIPKGWEFKTIGEVAEFAYGKALKSSDRKPGDVPVFGSNGQVGFHNESLVKGPGIVIGRKGNPGTVTWSYEDFFPIDTTFYVKSTGVVPSLAYLFYALKTKDLPSLSADSAVPGLNRNLAYMSSFLVPHEKVTEAFDEQVDPIFQTIFANEKEIFSLTSLRDTQLPKLISGELRVPKAEKILAYE